MDSSDFIHFTDPRWDQLSSAERKKHMATWMRRINATMAEIVENDPSLPFRAASEIELERLIRQINLK